MNKVAIEAFANTADRRSYIDVFDRDVEIEGYIDMIDESHTFD